MHRELSAGAQRRVPLAAFTNAYRAAAATATASRVDTGRPRVHGHEVVVPVTVVTRIFGTVRGTIALPLAGSGDAARIAWVPRLAFPGLGAGERLGRRTRLPRR